MQEVWENVYAFMKFLSEHLLLIDCFFAVIIVFFERKDPRAVWGWLLLLYFVPVVGFILYLLLGMNMRKLKMFKTKEIEDALNFQIQKQEENIFRNQFCISDEKLKEYQDLVLYNLEASQAVYTEENEVEVYTDGNAKFDALIDAIEQAENYILLQYYIIKSDILFERIVKHLKKKVKEGVSVRILVDGMGGRFVRKSYWKRLRAEGIEVVEFFPALLGRLQLRMNYRNHRKIVVVDGKVGFVGGFNVGKEYIGLDPKFGYWRDTHLKITGEAVIGLKLRFVLDWNYAARQNLFSDERLWEKEQAEENEQIKEKEEANEKEANEEVNEKEANEKEEVNEKEEANEKEQAGKKERIEQGKENERLKQKDKVGIQIISSGPDSRYPQIHNTYVRMIAKAKKSVYIQTPYFIPDESMITALEIAAMSGLDVRIMIPCKPDHPFVYWATYSYIGDMLAAGVKCYTYDHGFLHAKGIVVDGMMSCYGTANMDNRSFFLNFEVNAVIYSSKVAQKLTDIFLKDLQKSTEITKYDYSRRNLVVRLKEQVSRLLGPVL